MKVCVSTYNNKCRITLYILGTFFYFLVLSNNQPNLYQRINELVATDIGNKWKDFARALNIKEGKIDELDEKYRSIPDRVYNILQFHRSNPRCTNERNYVLSIANALTKARRNDLRKQVEEIVLLI